MKEEKFKIELSELNQYPELVKYLRKICKYDAFLVIQVKNSKCFTQFAYDTQFKSLRWEFPSLEELSESKKQKLIDKGFNPPTIKFPEDFIDDFTDYDYRGNPNYHKEMFQTF